jgi:hypothetical protein
VLCRGGVIWRARSNRATFRWGTWFFAVAMAAGAVPNFASQSRWENVVLAPLALVLAALSVVVARGATTESKLRRPHAAPR